MTKAMDRSSSQCVTDHKVIYNYVPINRKMTLTIEEFKSLVNHFDYGHPLRLCFILMGCYGLRSMEVTNIRLHDIKEDAKFLDYVIGKKLNVKKYVTGTVSNTSRIRRVELFDSVRRELLFYIENNYHLFKDRFIFPFTKDSLRRYLSKLRSQVKDGQIKCVVLRRLLLDQEGERYGFGVSVQPAYRFTLHSFRRFFLTYFYHVKSDRDLVMTQLEIGHELKETTMIYMKRPSDIGLTPGLIKRKLDFESLIYGQDQLTLEAFK